MGNTSMKRWHLKLDIDGHDPVFHEVELCHGQHANMNAPEAIVDQTEARVLAVVDSRTYNNGVAYVGMTVCANGLCKV